MATKLENKFMRDLDEFQKEVSSWVTKWHSGVTDAEKAMTAIKFANDAYLKNLDTILDTKPEDYYK